MRSDGKPTRARPGGFGEVAEAEPQHDRAAGAVAVAEPAREPIDDLGEDEVEFLGRARAAAERALRADGSASLRGVDRARIPQPGQRVQVRAGRLAEQPLGRGLFELGELTDGADAEPVQLLGGDGADAPQPFHGRGRRNSCSRSGSTTSSPSGLLTALATLARNLVRAIPTEMARPTSARTRCPQSHRDLLGRAGDAPEPADLQERLVDRQSLDERGRVAEDREHVLARRGVRVHPRRDDDGLGAEVARLPAAHRGAHSARLRLVTRRQHHAAADDDGRPRSAGASRCSTEA